MKIACLLPKNALPSLEPFIEAGFIFEDCNDQLFSAILPNDWLTVPATDGWKNFIDEKGQVRGSYIFSQLCSKMLLTTRYSIDYKNNGSTWNIQVTDHLTGSIILNGKSTNSASLEALKEKTKIYLNTCFPNWENPLAYWA